MVRSRAFLSLNLAHFFDHYVLLILPTAALAIGVDYADALAPATWAFVAFALLTMPVGWLGDRWGRVPMMRLFWFGTGAGCLIAGLAPGGLGLIVGMRGHGRQHRQLAGEDGQQRRPVARAALDQAQRPRATAG
ncbi:MAG: hypothetical protein U1E17_23800 [Geminicoccaceae bacterium]